MMNSHKLLGCESIFILRLIGGLAVVMALLLLNIMAANTEVVVNTPLSEGSQINGTVTGPDGTTLLADIEVSLHLRTSDGSGSSSIGYVNTDSNGFYKFDGLSEGSYFIQLRDHSKQFVGEYYDKALTSILADDILVSPETTVLTVNVSLASASYISGVVTSPDGSTPLSEISVSASLWTGDYWFTYEYAISDETGNYLVRGLPAGTYRIRFYDWSGTYPDEYYDNAIDLNSATDIEVPYGTVVSNINASLANPSTIRGMITDVDGIPLSGIQVNAYHFNGEWWGYVRNTYSDENGHYVIGGLLEGNYRIWCHDSSGEYAAIYYQNSLDIDSALDVVVPADSTISNINVSLTLGGSIMGTVTGPDGTSPDTLIFVFPFRWSGSSWIRIYGENYVDMDGSYSIKGLAAGVYRVYFRELYGSLVSQFYDRAWNLDAATDILVPAGATVSNINAILDEHGDGLPDLVVQSIQHEPMYPRPGDVVTFTVRVVNQGVGIADVGFSTGLWTHQTETPEVHDDPDYLLPYAGAIYPDSGIDLTVEHTASTEGSYTSWAFADVMQYGRDSIQEEDETNNAGPMPHGYRWHVVDRFSMTTPPQVGEGDLLLRWESRADAYYTIYTKTNLLTHGVELTAEGIPATPPLNTYTASVEDVDAIFWMIGEE